MDGDILAIKSSGIVELSPHLGLLPERAGPGMACFSLLYDKWNSLTIAQI